MEKKWEYIKAKKIGYDKNSVYATSGNMGYEERKLNTIWSECI